MMGTFEITLQRKIGLDWPAVSISYRPGDFLPVRSESRLQLDLADLLRTSSSKDYGQALGKALFRDDLRDALAQAREDRAPLRILLNMKRMISSPCIGSVCALLSMAAGISCP
jgi:hypothetical protein